jgi:hypothetical protein
MGHRLSIGVVALLAIAFVAPMAHAATQVRQVRVPIPAPTTTPPTLAGTLALDFVFKNKRTSKRKFTPRQLTRIDFSQVPLVCENNPGEGSSILRFTTTLNTNVKLTKAPPPGGKKPKPGRYAFRFSLRFESFTGTLRGTIDKPNRPGKRPLRSQGSLDVVDLDANPGHTNCSTRGPKSWGGLPVTLVSRSG